MEFLSDLSLFIMVYTEPVNEQEIMRPYPYFSNLWCKAKFVFAGIFLVWVFQLKIN